MRRLFAACFIALAPTLTAAHEFWLEARDYTVRAADEIAVNLKNGQRFEGITLAYFSRNIVRFDWIMGNAVTEVAARMGDVPALVMTPPDDGLLTVVHETVPSRLVYKEWDKFQDFADHKDFPDIGTRHDARGLPRDGFAERYSRHAKALLAVGDGAGTDKAHGLETEIVALENPYTFGGETLPVRVFYQGAVRADVQVEIFERAPDGTVTVTTTRTDDDGVAQVPVAAGHTYLLDAVVLRETDADDAVWETLWAALTFAVP